MESQQEIHAVTYSQPMEKQNADRYKPAEDFQQLRDPVEVLSFIYEPETHTTWAEVNHQ